MVHQALCATYASQDQKGHIEETIFTYQQHRVEAAYYVWHCVGIPPSSLVLQFHVSRLCTKASDFSLCWILLVAVTSVMTCCAASFFEILNGLFFFLKKCASSETGAVCPESCGVQRNLVWRKQLNIIKVTCVCVDVRYVANTLIFLVGFFFCVCFRVMFLFVWHCWHLLHKWSWN